ncbi:hypothetical protein MED222_22654 [Vibrio sp. MED222]|nr:hypothetical protein MED222_22654 [Vibrio sp. MED222]
MQKAPRFLARLLINGGVLGVAGDRDSLLEDKIIVSRNDESLVIRLGFLISGGVDGTRTRDPRRDRPVF